MHCNCSYKLLISNVYEYAWKYKFFFELPQFNKICKLSFKCVHLKLNATNALFFSKKKSFYLVSSLVFSQLINILYLYVIENASEINLSSLLLLNCYCFCFSYSKKNNEDHFIVYYLKTLKYVRLFKICCIWYSNICLNF